MLVAINAYAERLEGDVVVWLVISRADGHYTALTLSPADVEQLVDALKDANEKAATMLPGDATTG